jgi:hypothetical protein
MRKAIIKRYNFYKYPKLNTERVQIHEKFTDTRFGIDTIEIDKVLIRFDHFL